MKIHFFKIISKIVFGLLMSRIGFAYEKLGPCPLEDIAYPKKTMGEVVSQLKQLENNESCKNLDKICELRGEGDVAGIWKKHRIFYNQSAIAGSNDMDELFESVIKLQASGICKGDNTP